MLHLILYLNEMKIIFFYLLADSKWLYFSIRIKDQIFTKTLLL
jgi:hypothetical protein